MTVTYADRFPGRKPIDHPGMNDRPLAADQLADAARASAVGASARFARLQVVFADAIQHDQDAL
jgi:hypothetical protein